MQHDNALQPIAKALAQPGAQLIHVHGLTGSGKTNAIRRAVMDAGTCLYFGPSKEGATPWPGLSKAIARSQGVRTIVLDAAEFYVKPGDVAALWEAARSRGSRLIVATMLREDLPELATAQAHAIGMAA